MRLRVRQTLLASIHPPAKADGQSDFFKVESVGKRRQFMVYHLSSRRVVVQAERRLTKTCRREAGEADGAVVLLE